MQIVDSCCCWWNNWLALSDSTGGYGTRRSFFFNWIDLSKDLKSEPVRHLSTSDSTSCIALGISFLRKSLLFFINSPFSTSLFVVVDCWWINTETVLEYQMRCWLTKENRIHKPLAYLHSKKKLSQESKLSRRRRMFEPITPLQLFFKK